MDVAGFVRSLIALAGNTEKEMIARAPRSWIGILILNESVAVVRGAAAQRDMTSKRWPGKF
jgi:hypothetical protein